MILSASDALLRWPRFVRQHAAVTVYGHDAEWVKRKGHEPYLDSKSIRALGVVCIASALVFGARDADDARAAIRRAFAAHNPAQPLEVHEGQMVICGERVRLPGALRGKLYAEVRLA